MTVAELAEYLGCHVRHARTLCQTKRIKARKVSLGAMEVWVVPEAEAKRYKDVCRSMGWPRGKPRK